MIKKAAKAAMTKLSTDKIRKIALRARLRVLGFVAITLDFKSSVTV